LLRLTTTKVAIHQAFFFFSLRDICSEVYGRLSIIVPRVDTTVRNGEETSSNQADVMRIDYERGSYS
jgi:hypothetical protein